MVRSMTRVLHRKALGIGTALALLSLAGALAPPPLGAEPSPGDPGPPPITATVPSCDPRTLVTRQAGLGDASGTGTGTSRLITYTDTRGTPLPAASGVVRWSYRAIVREPTGMPQISHDIAGYLNLDITTSAGHQLSFRAHCIAGAGMLADSSITAVLIYANGTTTDWPRDGGLSGGHGARRSFVHFESFQLSDGRWAAYVALVDGEDCAVNFNVQLVTERLAVGTGTFSGPTAAELYTETDCTLLSGPGRSIRGGPLTRDRLTRLRALLGG